MEQKILSFLKTKLPGLQESFLLGVAKEYSKTITEDTQIETTFSDGVLNLLKFSANQLQTEGDRRAQSAQKTALENWRKEHGLDENGNKIENKGEPAKTEGQPDLKALIEEAMKPLVEKISSFEKEKHTLSRSTILSEAVKNAPQSIKTKVLKDFGRMNFASDEEFTSYLEETKTDLAEVIQEHADGGLHAMGKPVVGGNASQSQQAINDIKAWSEKTKEKETKS